MNGTKLVWTFSPLIQVMRDKMDSGMVEEVVMMSLKTVFFFFFLFYGEGFMTLTMVVFVSSTEWSSVVRLKTEWSSVVGPTKVGSVTTTLGSLLLLDG